MISSTTRIAGPYPGTGLQTNFPFSFKVFQPSDVLVILTDSSGNNTPQTLTSQYTVALNSNQDTSPGGVVSMVAAPATGYQITLSSQVPNLQGTNLTNAGNFYPQSVDNALDYLTILIQQLALSVANALQLPITVTGISPSLPTPVAQAIIGWNSAGTGLQNYAGAASVLVSSAMQPVVGAATLALARSALGITPANIGAQPAGSYQPAGNYQPLLAYTAADDSKVVHLTGAESIAGQKTFSVQPNITTAQSMVHLDGQNGWGSTNTYIRRFTNVRANQGSDITYTDSATLGASFTINTSGVYAIGWDDNFGGQMWAGLTVNDTYPTVGILTMQSSAPSQIIGEGLAISNGSSNAVTVHRTMYLVAGSVIRAHTDGNSGGALTNATHFTITRVS